MNPEKDFLKTRVNCALVFKCGLEDVQRAKEALSGLGVELIYQKISLMKLIIQEETK